jgi:hypothetical protein
MADQAIRAIPKLVEDFQYLMDDGAAYYQAFDGFCTKWNLPCCQSCGIDELRSLRDEGELEGEFYAFCHSQDVQGIEDSGKCYLSYGSFDPAIDTADVGHRLVSALRSVGFVVEWDGDTSHRIKVCLDCFAPALEATQGGNK